MALPIIQDIGSGGRLGAALGTGLAQLAEHKLAQLSKQYQSQQERSQFAQGLTPILGQDTANFLSALGPDERKYALQNIGSLMQLNQPTAMTALQQPVQQEQAQTPQTQITPERTKLIQDIFTSPQEKREREKLELTKRQTLLKETKPYVESLKNQEKSAKESDLRLKRMEALINKGNLPNAALWSFLTKIEDLGPVATGAAGAVVGHIFPGLGHAVGGLVGALSSPLAGAMKSLIKTGSPDIEEFEKLSTDFVKNAKQYFGARLTDRDLITFMQTIPTLMQTDAGKKKVIDNLRSLNELSQIESKTARSIIKANGGIPPIDLEQQVKDKIGKKIDKVAKEFIGRS